MHVGIDITSIIYHRGVSRYTSNLVRALLEQKVVHLTTYGSSLRQADVLRDQVKQWRTAYPFVKFGSVIQTYPPTAQEYLWNVLGRNRIRPLMQNVDVFHSWDWLQPPDRDLPLVSTIHDLAILKYPETAHPKIRRLHEHAWKVLKAREAQIIAVSHATKQDIVELLGFPSEHVHVVYEALPNETLQVSETLSEEKYEQVKLQLGLAKPYILFVGTREPRKNLGRLIEAWEPLQKDVDLIVAGEAGWDETSASGVAQKPGLRFLGKVSDQQLAVLYGEAELLAYPSLYEGFGLPILEAFSVGTPVVTSATSSMPEVAGNAAELVHPTEVESIRAGLMKVLGENTEQQRHRLQKMILRLQLFDWAQVATQTVAVYQRAVEQNV